MSGGSAHEQGLRRHLDEAHRQLTERDKAFESVEAELHRIRERDVVELSEKLESAYAWAHELDEQLRRMQETRSWRLAVRLQDLGRRARQLTRRP